jgi:hypothetical protein
MENADLNAAMQMENTIDAHETARFPEYPFSSRRLPFSVVRPGRTRT